MYVNTLGKMSENVLKKKLKEIERENGTEREKKSNMTFFLPRVLLLKKKRKGSVFLLSSQFDIELKKN